MSLQSGRVHIKRRGYGHSEGFPSASSYTSVLEAAVVSQLAIPRDNDFRFELFKHLQATSTSTYTFVSCSDRQWNCLRDNFNSMPQVPHSMGMVGGKQREEWSLVYMAKK